MVGLFIITNALAAPRRKTTGSIRCGQVKFKRLKLMAREAKIKIARDAAKT
jgi:hypothetical protein